MEHHTGREDRVTIGRAKNMTAKQDHKTTPFYLQYSMSMAAMGRKLGITKEAVRKRFLRNSPMLVGHLPQRNKHRCRRQLSFQFISSPVRQQLSLQLD